MWLRTARVIFIVMLTIAFLAWVFRPRLCGHGVRTPRQIVRFDLFALSSELQMWAIIHEGRFPSSLNALIDRSSGGNIGWNESSIPKDPWDNQYMYFPPVKSQSWALISLGADGTCGGYGDDADQILLGDCGG